MKPSKLNKRIKTLDVRKVGSASTKRLEGATLTRIRKRILIRDGQQCTNCKRILPTKQLEIDHKVPLHLGGAECDENRQTLCKRCHAEKTAGEERERSKLNG